MPKGIYKNGVFFRYGGSVRQSGKVLKITFVSKAGQKIIICPK